MSFAGAAPACARPTKRRYARCSIALLLVMGIASVGPTNAGAINGRPNDPGAETRHGTGGALLYAYNKQNPRPYAPPAPTPLKPGKSLRRPPGALAHRRQHRAASTMLNQQVLASLAGLLALVVGAQWVAATVRFPATLLALILGVLAGPATKLISPDALLGNLLLPLISLALAVILFEASLNVRFSELRSSGAQLLISITIGLVVAGGIGAGAAYLLLDLPVPVALLLGVAGAVVGPRRDSAQRQADANDRGPQTFLQREAVLLELSGTVFVVLLFDGILFGTASYPQDVLLVIINTVWIGSVVGLVGAATSGLVLAKDSLPESLRRALALTLLCVVFTAAELLQATAGFIAVITMGLTLPNWKPGDASFDVRPSLLGQAGLSIALLAVLAARLQPSDLEQIDAASILFLAAVMLLARPLAVGLSTLRTGWSWTERLQLACLAPRGVMAAALATIFALRLVEIGFPAAGEVVPLALLVVFGTAALDAVAAPLLRRSVGTAAAKAPEHGVTSRSEIGA